MQAKTVGATGYRTTEAYVSGCKIMEPYTPLFQLFVSCLLTTEKAECRGFHVERSLELDTTIGDA